MKNKIRTLRIKRKLSQSELAKLTGLSQAYINELENGKKNNPTYEVLQKLAKALGVPVSALLEDTA